MKALIETREEAELPFLPTRANFGFYFCDARRVSLTVVAPKFTQTWMIDTWRKIIIQQTRLKNTEHFEFSHLFNECD